MDIDIDDAYFVALHLSKKHKIWTGDNTLAKALRAKGHDFCITTAELKRKLYKKPQ
jgi:predicted nucleic acid-binding protein